MNIKRSNKGFTLVEVLIVLIIIGVLVALALPRYFSARTDAESNVCRGNQRTVKSQLEGYRLKAGSYPSNTTTFNAFTDSSAWFSQPGPKCPLNNTRFGFTSSTSDCTVTCPNGH